MEECTVTSKTAEKIKMESKNVVQGFTHFKQLQMDIFLLKNKWPSRNRFQNHKGRIKPRFGYGPSCDRSCDTGSMDGTDRAFNCPNSPARFYKPWLWNLLRRKRHTKTNQILKERWESSYRMTWMNVESKGLALNPKYSSVWNNLGPEPTEFKNKYWVDIKMGNWPTEELAKSRLNFRVSRIFEFSVWNLNLNSWD